MLCPAWYPIITLSSSLVIVWAALLPIIIFLLAVVIELAAFSPSNILSNPISPCLPAESFKIRLFLFPEDTSSPLKFKGVNIIGSVPLIE